ncbi:MAG: hypothetical protein M1813_000346 [Trichoglossum hirsutum]|nr:MAG: hypothetical protein M1813_000346 [Trichoglossum hirsutum]
MHSIFSIALLLLSSRLAHAIPTHLTRKAPGYQICGPDTFCQTLGYGCMDIAEGCCITVPSSNTVPKPYCSRKSPVAVPEPVQPDPEPIQLVLRPVQPVAPNSVTPVVPQPIEPISPKLANLEGTQQQQQPRHIGKRSPTEFVEDFSESKEYIDKLKSMLQTLGEEASDMDITQTPEYIQLGEKLREAMQEKEAQIKPYESGEDVGGRLWSN